MINNSVSIKEIQILFLSPVTERKPCLAKKFTIWSKKFSISLGRIRYINRNWDRQFSITNYNIDLIPEEKERGYAPFPQSVSGLLDSLKKERRR